MNNVINVGKFTKEEEEVEKKSFQTEFKHMNCKCEHRKHKCVMKTQN